jgi:hypothetical protein
MTSFYAKPDDMECVAAGGVVADPSWWLDWEADRYYIGCRPVTGDKGELRLKKGRCPGGQLASVFLEGCGDHEFEGAVCSYRIECEKAAAERPDVAEQPDDVGPPRHLPAGLIAGVGLGVVGLGVGLYIVLRKR